MRQNQFYNPNNQISLEFQFEEKPRPTIPEDTGEIYPTFGKLIKKTDDKIEELTSVYWNPILRAVFGLVFGFF